MTCARCTCLQEQAVACSPTSSSATNPSLPSSGTPTAAESCASEPQTDGFRICTCTREMFGCSIHPNTPAQWIASQRDSLARMSATLERELVSAKAPEAGFTAKSCALLGQYDRATCSWKTSQQSFLCSEPSLVTWPRWGMTVAGVAYAHPQSERRIIGTAGGASELWPTPHMNCHTGAGEHGDGGPNLQTAAKMWDTPQARDHFPAHTPEYVAAKRAQGHGMRNLNDEVKMWQTPVADDSIDRKTGKWNSRGEPKLSAQVKMCPIPTASDHRNRGTLSNPSVQRRIAIGKQIDLSVWAGGQLNPTWVEWLMAWPLGFTVSKHSATAKSRSKPQSRGDCSEGRK